jgi:CheY-like chemotaxis protein
MLSETTNLLIVDHDVRLRILLSAILTKYGYRVRSAADHFSALVEIRNEPPDIIVSGLKMPSESGFELFSVIRSRYPAIQVIDVSGGLSDVPHRAAADAFYEMGGKIGSLLLALGAITHSNWSEFVQYPSTLARTWIPKNGRPTSAEVHVMIPCPECFRAFPQVLFETMCPVYGTTCVYCYRLIYYAIVPAGWSDVPDRSLAETMRDNALAS